MVSAWWQVKKLSICLIGVKVRGKLHSMIKQAPAKGRCLYIRRFDTREIVERVAVPRTDRRNVEKIMMGMLRNMNTEDYFVDDSEAYE